MQGRLVLEALKGKGKTGTLKPYRESGVRISFRWRKEKGSKAYLLPFFFVRFLLDSGANLY